MDIATLIPFGKENAVSRMELQQITGHNDRKVRELIETAQYSGIPIINMQNGKGYFKPTQAEEKEFILWSKREYSRGMKSIKKIKTMRTSFYHKQSGGSNTQMSIFDFIGEAHG